MSISLYISNEQIAAVAGGGAGKRFTVKACAAVPVPAGSVLGGVITDERGLSDALDSLFEKLSDRPKSVRLVLSSSQIIQKRSVVPKLPRKKLLEWAKNEFADVDTEGDELIYDCMLLGSLGEGKGDAALLCAARKGLIAPYVELLSGKKIRIDCIDTTLSALQKLVWFLPETREATFIILALDGNILDAMLFVKGEYRFSNRTRLIAARGTAESTAEVSRMVSSLIQFNLSERSGESIACLYALGSTPGETGMLQSITTAYDLPASVLTDASGSVAAKEDGFRLADYAFAVGDRIGI